jgi:ribokinase
VEAIAFIEGGQKMNKKAKIVVVGSINMDLVVRSNKTPVAGETVSGLDFTTIPGGKGANQAVAAARLGAQVEMIGCVGDDAFGQQMLVQLTKEGVGQSQVRVLPHMSTGVALIQVEQGGDNRITIISGANAGLLPEHLELAEAKAMIAKADILLVQLEIPLETVIKAIQLAHSAGVKVILNPAPAKSLPPSIWKYVDLVTPNETEAAILTTGRPNAGAALHLMDELRALTQTNIIITQGAKGVDFNIAGKSGAFPAYRVEVVDTTAAGDSFNAGLAVLWGEGMPLAESISFASKAAALTVTRFGAQTSLPTRDEVNLFRDHH